MAPIRLQRLAAATDIPRTVPLLEALRGDPVLRGDQIEELDVAQAWRTNKPFESMKTPIGRQSGE
jgi:hypothetical protein